MNLEYLTGIETKILDGFLVSGQINTKMLLPGMSIGMDSMGPMRDPGTDQLFPGIPEALGHFSETLQRNRLMFVVATNGPDIEGVDILKYLEGPVAAYAVTQGGGKLISRHPQTNELEYTMLADEEELKSLSDLEAVVTERPLMRALLEDRLSTDGKPPTRTPYDANIVITLPNSFDVLNARLSAAGIDLLKELPEVRGEDYVRQVLDYAHDQYMKAILEMGLVDRLAILTKLPNRRNYVTTKHLHNEDVLSKYGGVLIGSQHLAATPGYHNGEYRIENSIYVADNAVDQTKGEGQEVIGVSERSMIVGHPVYYLEDSANPTDMNVTNISAVKLEGGRTLYLGEATARLALNVTIDDSLPKIDRVENVPILHIGSGLKSLEAIDYLFRRLHG